MPAHADQCICFPICFKLIRRSSLGCVFFRFICQGFLVLIYPTIMTKIFNYGQKRNKKHRKQNLTRKSPANKKPGHRRCGSSTYQICMETALFESLFFHDSTSQDKKLLLMLPFKESQWKHMFVVSGVCLSVFATAIQGML